MSFGLLGPLLVRSGETNVCIRQGKQRTLLAVLLLNAGRVVSVEKLIDALWGDNPPPSADIAVRNYVMRLRRDLGEVKTRVRTQPPGYLIAASGDELDVARFETLLESARTAAESRSWDETAVRAAEALALWRGDPLADVESDVLARQEVPRLAELRLRAVETRIEADLRLGRHAELVAELEQLTGTHPLRENLWAHLMLALYESGRQAEALAAYQRAREQVVDALGIEPGDALRDLHQRILAGDIGPTVPGSEPSEEILPEPGAATAPAPAVPRQLPRVVSRFVGRERELSRLSRLLDRSGEPQPGSVVISAIGGTAGVGKTALAVRWAHQVSDRFPDGQLYVNLRGYDPGQPVAAAEALEGFLRALGVPGDRIPPGTDERSAEFRSLLAGRKMLIVLDNAREADQVRPLLPGSSECLVLVTSRDALTGLVVRDGAVRVDLDLLPSGEAEWLLESLIGERATASPAAVAQLAERCCRLPLALRVAAELANARPGVSLADLAAELADRQGRLDLLNADGDARSAVREVFSWSYRYLDAATARGFRLAGLHPGPDFDAYSVAALTSTGPQEVRRSLERLARASLIQHAGPGRYALHDLLSDYAQELSAAHDDEEARRAAVTRLLDYYVFTAGTAVNALSLFEEWRYRPVNPQLTTGVPAITDETEASVWLEAERASLGAVAVHAAAHGWPGHAITLSAVLFRYLSRTFYSADMRTIHASAFRAARASGDRNGEVHALNNLASVDWQLGRFRQAERCLREALVLFREVSDRNSEARTLNNLGAMGNHLGRFRSAVEYLRESLVLGCETGNRYSEVRARFSLSFAYGRLGRYQEATDCAREALMLSREMGNPDLETYAQGSLGSAYSAMGRYEEATDCLSRVREAFQKARDRAGEAETVMFLADIDRKVGRSEQAVRHVRQGLELCREIGEWIREAWAVSISGDVLFSVGQHAEARVQYTSALELSDRSGDPYDQARAHHGLGRVHRELGDPVQARSHWEQALALYAEMETPEAEEVRAELAALKKDIRA